jgi:cobalt/nickel transport system permease protein
VKERLILLAYLVVVFLATLVHDPWILLGLAAVVVMLSGRAGPGLLLRVLRAVWPFIVAVSLGYLLVGRGDWRAAAQTLLLINSRVIALTLLTFAVFRRLDLQKALGFSGTLRFVLILTTSQVLTFRRLFADFRQALESRMPGKVGLLTALRHGAATSAWFLRRAEHDATEITQALDARGFFLDRD